MSAVTTPAGVAFVRDDFKATSDSLAEILAFLTHAQARRKIVVVGQISDHPGRSRPFYSAFARSALPVVDRLLFVGDRAEELWGGPRRASLDGVVADRRMLDNVAVFATVREAADFLRQDLRSGDLVVLKGSGPSDHLERVLFAQTTNVGCWRAHCGRVVACDDCDLLSWPADLHDAVVLKTTAL